MDKTIDITNDYIFKGIFRDEARTRNFLKNILIGEGKILPSGTEITTLEYLPHEYIQDKIPELAKKTVFDLQVNTTEGIFIIEMQKSSSLEYLKRLEFYTATAYANQQIKGSSSSMKDYTNALPIVTISVINDKILEDQVPCISYHTTIERKTQQQYMKALSYVFIELEKFGKEQYDQGNITSEDERDWLLFMTTQNLDHTYHNEQVNNAVKYVKDIRDNKYDEYVRAQIAEVAALKEKEEAENKGIEKGRKEEKQEIAKTSLQEGLTSELISKITGLSISEVNDIKKSLED